MRKISSFLGLLLAFLLTAVNAAAQAPGGQSAALTSPFSPLSPAGQDNSPAVTPPLYEKAGLPVVQNFKLKDVSAVKKTSRSNAQARSGKAAPASVSDLTGRYVMTWTALTTSLNDGGSGVIITQGADDNSIVIEGFWSEGLKVNATVDFAAKTITIPTQKLYTHDQYGQMSLCLCTSTGAPDRSASIEGMINDDGTMTLTSWWGVYVDSGQYADNFVAAYGDTEFDKANGTMSYKKLVTTTTPFSYEEGSYSVAVRQEASNLLTVKNFANYGQTVEILLSRDKTASIESQLARKDATNGDWYTYAITYDEATGKLTDYSGTITVPVSADSRSLAWSNWSLLNTGTTKYYAGINTEGKITTDFDITYPQLSVTEFEGEGTESKPYLIKTLDDLVLLSDRVAEVTDFPYTTPPSKAEYARVYLGKHFRLENDIDMTGYRFKPIGNDWQHIFAGTFDGNGHKITGLNISEDAYAGMFGRTDTLSVIKNLTIDKPVVKAAGYYAAAIVGWSLGTIANCHVTNADVYNAGRCAAGIAGIATDISDCSVTNSTIRGLGGNAAALAGEVDGVMQNCHATGMKITAAAPAVGYPSGGLAGGIYKGKILDSYFSGSVDGISLYSEGQFIGGVAGSSYLGTVERCFSVGTVSGYYNNARVGGVVGSLTGGKLSDSYAVGMVWGWSSRMTGGITGYVASNADVNGNVTQSEVRSCYTATQIYAETYQYKPETEVREALGSIEENSTPTIADVYFDNKITNFTSTKYGVPTSTLTSASGVAGFDASVWSFTEGQYPVLTGLKDAEAAKYSSSALLFTDGSSLSKMAANATIKALGDTKYNIYKGGNLSTEGRYCKINGSTLEISDSFGTDTLFVVNGKDSYYWTLKVAPVPYDGDGTELNPYLIKTKDDLIKLSEFTTRAKQQFPGTYFKMTNDIDLELDDKFLGICSDEEDVYNSFSGIFDGAGHTLHRMYINSVAWETKPGDSPDGIGTPIPEDSRGWKGFIGRMEPDGVVKNLNIAADCKIYGWGTLGAFVGSNEGLIDNCRNYADVTGYSCWIGAFAGQNEKSGIITNCYNDGHIISGYMAAGGITGYNNGTVENCANAGDVEVKSISNFQKPTSTKLNRAGGIAGGSAAGNVIKNVVNAGRVYAHVGYAGGITPTLKNVKELSNAINYGVVYNNAPVTLGAIAGETYANVTSSDNYWDAQVVAIEAAGNAAYAGMTGVETSTLTSGTALKNFSTDLWQFDAGQYPVLKRFADETLLSEARRVIVSMPSGTTAKDVKEDAVLNTANGETWTLADGTLFSIEGNTLKAPAAVEEVKTDTLIATSGRYVKPILIKRLPVIPLSGDGTEESPYIISNAEEWNELASYMEGTQNNLAGRFVKVAADIDFTSTPLASIGNDGLTYFGATLDGDGRKLSGIALTTDNSYQGVFGTIGESGTVKNLTIAGKITSANTYTGGFAGKLYGTLDNCVSLLDITSTKSNVAGIVGYAYSGAVLNRCVNKGTVSGSNTNIAGVASATDAGVTFTDCGNEGTVENTSAKSNYTAGLVGTALPGTFTRCYNTGSIVIKNSTAVSNVAGLVAYANGYADAPTYTFTDCYNKADIDAKAVVAGLVALVGKSDAILKMSGCYNEGDVTAVATSETSSSPTAGLSVYYTPGSVFENCWNKGMVMSQKNVWVAGITAYYMGRITAETPVLVKNCYNTGSIVASGNQGSGIMAYCDDYVTIDSCYNTGSIEGGFGLGGIVGYLSGATSVVSNCWNAGNVTTSTYRAGGIFAWNYAQALVENCFNIGNIASSSELGGVYSSKNLSADCIGGIAGDGGARIVNCYNAGTVTGLSRVGGIIGSTVKGMTALTSCYNIGKIVAPADTCGALVGSRTDDNPKSWADGNSVTDCYYVTDLQAYGTNNAVGTATTVAELAAKDLGEEWTSADGYSLPVLKTLDNEAAKANSAAVVPAVGDTYSKITKAFFVGVPEGVTWTASDGNLAISGNNADFDGSLTSGDVTLTAVCGDYSRIWTVTLDGYTSSIDGLNVAGKNIVNTVFFTTDGRLAARPQSRDGKVYVVKVTYDDGSSRTLKLFNK